MKTNVGNETLFVNGYYSIFKCRTNFVGGVALLIKENIDFNELDLSMFNEEIVGFSTKIGAHNISFFSYYNPPSKELNREIILHIQNNFINYLIMGDLNSKNEVFNYKSTNKNGEILNDILTSRNCQIVNETFESTFHIIRHSGEDYDEFLDLFIGSPLIACKSIDY